MKIQVHLDEYITINGLKIKEIIQTEVFGYFKKCFEKAFEKIEKQIKILNFFDAQNKIKEIKSQFNQINNEAGNDIKQLDKFKDF